MDPRTRESIRFLEQQGYRYLFDRDVFVNRVTMKCFSLEYVEDHPDKLADMVLAPKRKHGWEFYFNRPPSLTLQNELGKLLTEAT